MVPYFLMDMFFCFFDCQARSPESKALYLGERKVEWFNIFSLSLQTKTVLFHLPTLTTAIIDMVVPCCSTSCLVSNWSTRRNMLRW